MDAKKPGEYRPPSDRGIYRGARFGSLVVVGYAKPKRDRNGRTRRLVRCKCDCGAVCIVRADGLRYGGTGKCKRCRYAAISQQQSKGMESVVADIRRAADRRGIEWSLTVDEATALIVLPCHYCGSEPGNVRKNGCHTKGYGIPDRRYSGLDRVDNSIGYAPGNVVPCCKRCNERKGDLTVTDMRHFIAKIEEHHAGASLSSSSSPAA